MTDRESYWDGRNKTSEEIRQDVDHTREELSRDIDEIQTRIRRERLKKEAEEKFEEVKREAQKRMEEVGVEISRKASETIHSVGSEITTALADRVRDVPWPVTLGAAALVWLAVDASGRYKLPRYQVSAARFDSLSRASRSLVIAGISAAAAGILIPRLISRQEFAEEFFDVSAPQMETERGAERLRTVYGADGKELNQITVDDREGGGGVIHPR
ncbi:MAG TPA: hypothetical protein VKZ59_00470 [Acidobacteriota bacterium]|nr:hypothetical protein [Acidobacteriota bacterium]